MKLVIGFHHSGGDRRSVLYQFARNQATPCYLPLNLARNTLPAAPGTAGSGEDFLCLHLVADAPELFLMLLGAFLPSIPTRFQLPHAVGQTFDRRLGIQASLLPAIATSLKEPL